MTVALRAAVRPIFDLGQPVDGKGSTLRAALESVERQTGQAPERLTAARRPIPPAFERVMALWQDLHRGRDSGGMGLSPIGWRDFHAYVAVTGEQLSGGDIEAVRVIDEAFLASHFEAQERLQKAQTNKPPGRK